MKVKLSLLPLWVLPSLIAWISLIVLINVTSPTPSTQILFFAIFFLAIFFTSGLLLKKIKFRFLLSFYLLLLPILLLFNQFSYLNLGLLTALFISLFVLIRQTPS